MAQIISFHLSEYTDVMSYAEKHFHGDFLMTLNFLYCMHNPVKDCWSKHLKRFLLEKRNGVTIKKQQICWDCKHVISEECGIDGHEVYPYTKACNQFISK